MGCSLSTTCAKRGPLAGAPRAGAAFTGDDVRGSGHIVSLARSVLGMAPVRIGLDPRPNAPRRLELLKTNLSPYPDPLGVTFVPSRGAHSSAGSVDLAYSPTTDPDSPRTHLECCARWLLEILADCGRPVSPGELEQHAHSAGYSRATLFPHAREILGSQVVDTHKRYHPDNHWVLPPMAEAGVRHAQSLR